MIAPQQQSYNEYALGVVAGEIAACDFIRRACQRFLDDLATAEERGLFFDEAAAQRAIRFVECLRHSKNEWRGQPLILSGWQRFILANVFGWKWRATGYRRFKRAYVEIPRKNGKSTLGAAIALYMLVADGEGAPEVYTAATSLEQAKIVFGECKRMVKASPALNARIAQFRAQLTIDNHDAVLAPLHSASENLDGLNTHCGIVDEYHEHRTSETYDKLRTSTGSRRQALTAIITTAGRSMESPCYRERREAVNLLHRVTTDDSLFAYIACADEGDDWRDERTWWKANPNLGVSRLLANMREDYAAACNSPAKEADFKRYFLDIWTNEEKRWIRLDDWRACFLGEPVPLEQQEEILRTRVCFGGLDVASSKDTTALAFYFPPTETETIPALYVRFFIPGDNIDERERRDKVPFSQWVREGWVTATAGNVTDTEAIRSEARRLASVFSIQSIGCDPWNMLTLGPQLIEDGFTLEEVRQGFQTLSSPTKEIEKEILRHVLQHFGNPVLTWQFGHCCVETDKNENIMPSKKASHERIDGPAATVMAKRMSMDSEEPAAVGLQFL